MTETKSGFNSGIRGGLFEKKHYDAMGEAVFLFGWLVTRQTKPDGSVYTRHHFTYPEISEQSGFTVRTLQRWMARLRKNGYILVEHTAHCRMIISIRNQKKFGTLQLSLPNSTTPHLADLKQGANPGSPPRTADSVAKSGGLDQSNLNGFVVGSEKSKDKTRKSRISTDPVELQRIKNIEARDRREMQEAKLNLARRELQIGSGPEIGPGGRVNPRAAENYRRREAKSA